MREFRERYSKHVYFFNKADIDHDAISGPRSPTGDIDDTDYIDMLLEYQRIKKKLHHIELEEEAAKEHVHSDLVLSSAGVGAGDSIISAGNILGTTPGTYTIYLPPPPPPHLFLTFVIHVVNRK